LQLHAAALRNSRAVYGITQCYLPPGSCDIPTRSVQSSSCAVNKSSSKGADVSDFRCRGQILGGAKLSHIGEEGGHATSVCVCLCVCKARVHLSLVISSLVISHLSPPPVQRRRRRAMICRLSTSPGRAGTVTCPLEGRVHLRSSALE